MGLSQNTDTSLQRLKKRNDFLRVQAAGQKWIAPTMVVQTALNEGSTGAYGLTVTKKTASSAVLRNRIRRRLRSSAVEVMKRYDIQGRDFVVIGRLGAETAPYEALLKDLSWCLRRLGVQEK